MGEIQSKSGNVNLRAVRAAVNRMAGMDRKTALLEAGYPMVSALQSRPTDDYIFGELRKVHPDATPAKLLSAVRDGLAQRFAATKWESESLVSVAKIVDIVERSYGAGEALDALEEARLAFDRGAFARELARLAVASATPQQVVDSQEADDVITIEDAKSAD